MQSNIKHIDEFFIHNESFKDKNHLNDWLQTTYITSQSKFEDSEWLLDNCDLYNNSSKSISWDRLTDSGHSLTDYPNILDSLKKTTFFLKTTLSGQKKRKSLSIVQNYYYGMYLINWMLDNKIYSFGDMSKEMFYKYITYLKKDKINLKNISAYVRPINYLYEFRYYLEDGIKYDYFENKPITTFMGDSKDSREQTIPIPHEVLEKVCHKILPIIDYFNENKFNMENILEQKIIIKPHVKKSNNTVAAQKRYVFNLLNGIGYFIIGLYTGMRVSEIMSLHKNSIEVDENNVLILNGTLFKLIQGDKGRPEKWGCGINNESNYALKIFKILSNFTDNNFNSLFFRYDKGEINSFPLSSMNSQLKDLMTFCEVDWDISTHQLRRTFARLIGITDKTCLVALKEHFKHASLAMTDYYVGNNLELLGLINEEKQQELAQGLESILSSNKLAGKLGEKLSKSNLKFRGDIVLRKNYIDDILDNSDLVFMPHEYGFCIYQPEQAKCRGETKNIGLDTCTKCNNFVVSDKHKVFWLNRVKQYEKFSEQIKNLPNQNISVEELHLEIEQANNIISNIT